jgi:hypothetical protein
LSCTSSSSCVFIGLQGARPVTGSFVSGSSGSVSPVSSSIVMTEAGS